MDLARPLTVITPTVDGDVLAVLARAEASFTGRQVHQVAGRHSERGIRNALHRLSTQGIVTRERVGSADQYRLNRAHLAAPHVEALAKLRDELLRRLAAEVQGWAVPAEFASLFGSAARGGMHPESDIDLLVLRSDAVDADDPQWRAQLDALASNVTAWTGNDPRIPEFRLGEYAQGDDHQEAVTLLSKADRATARYLKILLDLKTRSGYSATLTSKTDQKRAGRAAAALVGAARASA